MAMANNDSTNNEIDSPPWKLDFRSSPKFIVLVVTIATFTDVFIYGMIVPILPEVLGTRAGIPDDQLQIWMSILLAAFGGAILVGSPICGYFADKSTSRKIPFIVGLLALGGSTIMFWFAKTISWLVIARILQGLSGAVVWTVGMALIVDTVGKEEVGAAMGFASMGMTLGTVFGPMIGGVLLARAGYHSVFALAIAIIVLDIVLRLVMIEPKAAAKWRKGDSEAERLLGHEGPRYDNIDGHQDSDHEPEEHDAENGQPASKERSLPGIIRLLISGDLLVVLVSTVVDASIQSSFDSVLPLYVIRIFHWGPMLIGLCFLPLFVPTFVSPIIGAAVDRYGIRTIAFLGFLLDLPIFLLLRLITSNTSLDKTLLFIFLFFAGLASSMQMVALMTAVTYIVQRKEAECPGMFGHQGGTAQAYGLFNVAWAAGQVLGPMVAGVLVERHGWTTMVSVFGGTSGVIAVLMAFTSGKTLRLLFGGK